MEEKRTNQFILNDELTMTAIVMCLTNMIYEDTFYDALYIGICQLCANTDTKGCKTCFFNKPEENKKMTDDEKKHLKKLEASKDNEEILRAELLRKLAAIQKVLEKIYP